jgi:hypothetical protein
VYLALAFANGKDEEAQVTEQRISEAARNNPHFSALFAMPNV